VILVDQLKEIYFDAEIEPVDTTQWFPRLTRRDYPFALSLTGSGLDDPDSNFPHRRRGSRRVSRAKPERATAPEPERPRSSSMTTRLLQA